LSRAKTKSERAQPARRSDNAKAVKGSLPLTISRPELLPDGTDRDFRRLVHNIFAFMARHDAIRDGHARHIGLAGIEYTILISIGHLGLDGNVNVKTVADHLRMSGAFITAVTSKLQSRGLVEKTPDHGDRRRISWRSPKRAKPCCGGSRLISARSTTSSSAA
jgi:MarR family protein